MFILFVVSFTLPLLLSPMFFCVWFIVLGLHVLQLCIARVFSVSKNAHVRTSSNCLGLEKAVGRIVDVVASQATRAECIPI